MKFVCEKCKDDDLGPCEFKIPNDVKYSRDDYKKALRRCPFEGTTNNKLNGEVPIAEWVRVK